MITMNDAQGSNYRLGMIIIAISFMAVRVDVTQQYHWNSLKNDIH
ncbi:hypothetical protein ABE096_15110 [Robertmurraya massiliosenegalensis]